LLHFLEGSANQAYQAKRGKQSGESVLPAPREPGKRSKNTGAPTLEISKYQQRAVIPPRPTQAHG
jgi:hypothetical protein